ncbi:MAG: glutamyl-tRNA reductase [Bacteroidales bacterium]|nr:glutamyl-tRNA reductase [Bacteroidales bacterium]
MERMIGLIGLNYQSAPVEVRELVAFSEDQIREFIKSLKQVEAVAGVVVLSTCNRTEIYFHLKTVTSRQGFDLVYDRLSDYKNLEISVKKHFYFIEGYKAVKHLFTVTSGLNSMALGEDQIIGQVKNAFLISDHGHCAGPVLTRLFNRTFSAGKRVRTETRINEGAASVSSAAATLAKRQFPDMASRSVLLIGAGQTGRLSMLSLIEKGFKELYITNRTFEKAVEVARKFNTTAVPFDSIRKYLRLCDVVTVATGSTKPLITKSMMEEVMPKRDNRPLIIIDLSVPRNVAEDVGQLESVTVFDVDDTEIIIKETYKKRKAEIAKAEEIVNKMADNYMTWLSSLNLSPTIRQIQENFRKINNMEFENYHNFKNGTDRKPIRDYGSHIVDKFTRLIIENLKDLTDNGRKVEHLNMLNELFELTIANEK